MIWFWAFVIVKSIVLLAAFYYWAIVITEGVYFGRPLVVWLYDRFAPRYEGRKEFDIELERDYLAYPILAQMPDGKAPLVLDVAAGTGRLARAFHSAYVFDGHIVHVDAAFRMLRQGVNVMPNDIAASWAQSNADTLPFASALFDAVACLEALEFFPSDAAALAEMRRVLKPGGLLAITRRKGWEARTFIGRYRSEENMTQLLQQLGFVNVQHVLWQVDYDLVLAALPEQYA